MRFVNCKNFPFAIPILPFTKSPHNSTGILHTLLFTFVGSVPVFGSGPGVAMGEEENNSGEQQNSNGPTARPGSAMNSGRPRTGKK